MTLPKRRQKAHALSAFLFLPRASTATHALRLCRATPASSSMAGDLQGLPERVLAPQRGLASIGPVLPEWLLLIIGIRFKIDQIL